MILDFLNIIDFKKWYEKKKCKKTSNVFNSKENVIIHKIIDGDTIKINETSIRLLGINTPEKGEMYYEEAKEFLQNLILNQTVELEYGKERYDKYNRILAYVFFNNKNINIKIVEDGFANYYFPSGKDKYYFEFKEAWKNCIQSNKNLCEKSTNKCAKCINLKGFDYKKELIILKNICSFDCDLNNWELKAQGRKILKLNFSMGPNNEKIIEFKEIWNQDTNTLFLRDNEFKLVLWKDY